MKFSSIILGKRDEAPISFHYRDAELKFAFRPLDGVEEALVLERATEFARIRKAAELARGNPIFDFGVMVHSIALAAVDVGSPEGARELYFDGGEEAVLSAFGQEEIAYLYLRYEIHQGNTSPTLRQMSPADILKTIIDIARSDTDVPFVDLRPSMQLLCLRTTARLLLGSQDLSSLSTLLSSVLPTTSSEAPVPQAPTGDSPPGQPKA